MSTPAPPDAGPAGPAVPSSDAVLPVTAAPGGAAGAPAALSAPPTDTTKKRKRPPLCRGLDEFAQEKLLGSGTFGEVTRCVDKASGVPVALKRVKPSDQDVFGFPVTSVREIKALRALEHENIVKLMGMVVAPDVHMVFELCEFDLNGLTTRPDFQLSQDHIRCYMKQMLEGLEFMHVNHYIHRDIKGGNILVTKDHVVKIADFGLTRHMIDSKTMARMSASGMKLLTQRVVTAWWRPPEVHLGDNKYTEKADMWSIGAVFGEMLTGEPLFVGNGADVLKAIFDHCGTPTAENWPGHEKLEYYDELVDTRFRKPPQLIRKLHDRFPRLLSYVFVPVRLKGAKITESGFQSECALKGLALPRAGHTSEIALSGSRRLRSTLVAAAALFAHADVAEARNKAPREALDLLEKLLVLNPAKRLSATEALTHDYFRVGADMPTSAQLRAMLGPFPFASSTTLDAQALRHQGRQPVVPAVAAAVPPLPTAAVITATAASAPVPPPQPAAPRRPPPPAKPKVKEKIPDPDVDLGMFGLEFTVKKPPRMPPRPPTAPSASVSAGSTGQPLAVSQEATESAPKAS